MRPSQELARSSRMPSQELARSRERTGQEMARRWPGAVGGQVRSRKKTGYEAKSGAERKQVMRPSQELARSKKRTGQEMAGDSQEQ